MSTSSFNSPSSKPTALIWFDKIKDYSITSIIVTVFLSSYILLYFGFAEKGTGLFCLEGKSPINNSDSIQERSINSKESGNLSKDEKPLIIVVTPTYERPSQFIHFSHLINVLRIVPPPVLWIVVENKALGAETAKTLSRTAGKCMKINRMADCVTVDYRHIATNVSHEAFHLTRGVNQRNRALQLIEEERIEGIVYFMDDDNTYTPEVFEEIRKVKRVGIWPVGFLTSVETEEKHPELDFLKPLVERPLVKKENGKSVVYGWETSSWAASKNITEQRKFNSDMAGFAFRSNLLWEPPNPKTKLPKQPVRFEFAKSMIETRLLESLVEEIEALEPLANDCQEVNVWHTKLESWYNDPYPKDWRLPQPENLAPDKTNEHSPRYIVRGERYYIKDWNDSSLPFGYMKH